MLKDSMLVMSFESPAKWNRWLEMNHSLSSGIWLRIFKKTSIKKSVTYAEALDEALCFGWIDGQKDKFDAESWLQKFTSRRKNSLWSKVNTQHIERLLCENRMKVPGLREVWAAKEDGRWQRAYDSQRNLVIPEDFIHELERYPEAKIFFGTLNRSNLYSISFRLQTATSPETRGRRIKSIVARLNEGRKFH